ncbi:MAG TPA: SCO family protein [Beijerinckiaceae bacterium]|jgi:protein SCO1/2|nr:SCO family protein [Beijerinckiaceae bacterium]
MQTLTRFALAALVGAIAGAGLLWYRSGHDMPTQPQADRLSENIAKTVPSAAATSVPPPETFANVFAPCAHCHEIGAGARTMTGPPLTGIIGRKAASTPHYPYSEALRDSGIIWDETNLARFIADPQAIVPGTRMIFGGLPQKDIDALVAFIASVKNDGGGAQAPMSALAIGGPFTLVDTQGKTITDKDLLGKPSAIFFGYTHCPDVCPTTLMDLTNLLKKMGGDANKLNVVFITIDPARDTPQEMADYLSSFDPRIRGLTGTDAQVATAAKAYQVYYHRVPSSDGGYSMDHTASVFLMDAKGGFVGTLSYEEDERTSLAKIERLVKTAN